ncbi:aspartic peptidase domain-containing protein [Scheffersomyces amazonensis]|uniref:aspartic peptidase domain-containing protein n=1 Tax=Scheffersomyces amazonensis TaxID=1078765 RepID=UPI00315D1E1F
MKVYSFQNVLATIVCLSNVVLAGDTAPFKLEFEVKRANSKRELRLQDENYDHSPRLLAKRDGNGYVNMEISNQQTFYLASLKVGSNQDPVGVLVDTGSSDLWVMSHDLTCVQLDQSGNSKRQTIFEELDEGENIDVNCLFSKDFEIEIENDKSNNVNDIIEVEEPEIINDEIEDINKRDTNNWWPFGGIGGSAIPSGVSVYTIYYTGGGGNPGVGGGYPTQTQGLGTQGQAPTTNTCTQYGSFNTGNSDTWQKNNTVDFEIQYADNSEAFGVWGTDNVLVGSTNVTGLSLAVVNTTSSDVGVLGIGLPALEVTYANSVGTSGYTYSNLPLRLKNLGITNINLYSIYLGRANDAGGNVLFGAIDRAKISGNLTTLPIINTSGFNQAVRSQVVLNSVSFSNGQTNETLNANTYAAILDTGTTLSYFPTSLLQNLAAALGGSYSNSLGGYVVPCTTDPNAVVSFNFGGFVLNIPLGNLLLPGTSSVCILGILPQQETYLLLGDIVLRNAYWVYDLDNLQISVADVIFTDDEDIEVITSTIPGAIKAAGYSATSVGNTIGSPNPTALSFATGALTGVNVNTGAATTPTGSFTGIGVTNNGNANNSPTTHATSGSSTSTSSSSTSTGSSGHSSSGAKTSGVSYVVILLLGGLFFTLV